MTKTVTAMVPKARNQVQVYLDGQYAFSLSKKLAKEIQLDEALPEELAFRN